MSANACFHCGDSISGKPIQFDSKEFCCTGCSTVYQILSANNLDGFYTIDNHAGIKPKNSSAHQYAFLDVPEIRSKFIEFEDSNSFRTTLFLPAIHCSSCIYLLENLHKLDENVLSCHVNFTKRTAALVLKQGTSLAEMAFLLDRIGYAPNFGDQEAARKKRNFTYLYKLGVAGFAFGSIMLWSFPEYLGIKDDNPEIRQFTAYLSLAISIPVLLYSASEYLISAFKAIRFRSINLDVPISIGILALYSQSVYTILSGDGPGYMDSFAGFIFFLLIGKWFQSKSYESLSFDRDYRSYFPVAVTRIRDLEEEIVEIEHLKIDDTIRLRNEEVVPCDAVLESDYATIDYSFVTGESNPVTCKKGDFIYAGGRLLGASTQFKVVKESNRSQLTQLWNEASRKSEAPKNDRLSVYFLVALLAVAGAAALFWLFVDSTQVVKIVVAILIVACPCALALSRPFTYGNSTRALGRLGLYLKNADVIPKMNACTDVVFDKTGTLTSSFGQEICYQGKSLSPIENSAIYALVCASTHPLSLILADYLKPKIKGTPTIEAFKEISGSGLQGSIETMHIRVGSYEFAGHPNESQTEETAIFVTINGEYQGKFLIVSQFRSGIFRMLKELIQTKEIHILSGDSEKDKNTILQEVPEIKKVHFHQNPGDKKDYIDQLNQSGRKVLMIGDGLNDAGALRTADVGIAISEDIFRFTPGSDAIIDAESLQILPRLLKIAGKSRLILTVCLGFSILYNIFGLSVAISGHLTPLFAAILMPLSSISIVFISTIGTRIISKKIH